MRTCVLVVLFAVVAVAPCLARAANVSFLGDAPIAYMNDEDVRLFREAAGKALNDTADGKAVTWSNPDTEAGGKITLLRTDDSHAMLCRFARVENHAGGRQSRGVFRACKDANGEWRLAAQDSPAPKTEPTSGQKAKE